MAHLRHLLASVIAVLALAPARAQPVFVTDYYNDNIRRVDSVTGAPVTPPGGSSNTATTPLSPSAFAYGPDGNLYSANQVPTGGAGSLSKINPATGAVVSTITFSDGTNPGGLTFLPDGSVFVTRFSDTFSAATGSVQRYTIAGTTATPVGPALATGLNQPGALLLHGTDLYYTETNSADFYNTIGGTGTGAPNFHGGRLSVIRNVTTAPSAAQVLVTGPTFTGFAGMALAGNTLYYTELISGALDRYDIGTNTALSALVGPTGSLQGQSPSGLYIDSPTSILVASLGTSQNPAAVNGNLRRYSTVTTDTQIGGNIVSGISAGAVINAVPEPGTLALAGVAAGGFAAWRRRKRA